MGSVGQGGKWGGVEVGSVGQGGGGDEKCGTGWWWGWGVWERVVVEVEGVGQGGGGGGRCGGGGGRCGGEDGGGELFFVGNMKVDVLFSHQHYILNKGILCYIS